MKERFGKAFNNEERTVKEALDLAYADMSRRAQNHKDTNKSASIGYLLEEGSPFLKVINGEKTFKDQKEFDDWHQGICETLKERMTRNLFEGTIGKAQKVINMAFKYLMYTDKTCTEIHDYCHMTLDSYTLAWYKRVTEKKGSCTWSKIDDYDKYLLIKKKFGLTFPTTPLIPLTLRSLASLRLNACRNSQFRQSSLFGKVRRYPKNTTNSSKVSTHIKQAELRKTPGLSVKSFPNS